MKMIPQFINNLFGHTQEKLNPESEFTLSFDDESVTCLRPDRIEENIAWKNIDSVLIETNDLGPYAPDVYWLLLQKIMESGCIFPQGATGDRDLINELERRLDGFDDQMVIQAMASTDNQKFLIWKKDKL